MANPLESVLATAHKVPPMVWVIGGVGVLGFVAYRAISSAGANASTSSGSTVVPATGTQAVDPNQAIASLASQETQAIGALANQQTAQEAGIAQLLQQQQQTDMQSNQGLESIILGGLSQQEQNYQQLQGQTEGYLTQNQQSFSQAASTFAQAQTGMASSLATLWAKLSAAPAAPAQAPAPSDPTSAQIQQNAQGLGIPVYDIQGFVGEYHHLPGSIPELDNYLNAAGLRNPQTGALK